MPYPVNPLQPYPPLDPREYAIPFVYDGLLTPHLIVSVSIDEQAPLPFVVDTGMATGLILNRWVAHAQKRPLSATSHGFLGSRKISKVSLRTVTLLGKETAHDVRFRLNFAYVADLSDMEAYVGGRRIAGIVGAALLDASMVTIDFDAQMMTLYGKRYERITLPGTTCLPLWADTHRYWASLTIAEGVTVEAVLDTGASVTGIPKAFVSRVSPQAVIRSSCWTFKGVEQRDLLLLSSLALGNTCLNRVAVLNRATKEGALLGLNVLSLFRVTLDFRNRTLLLERREAYSENRTLTGYTGVRLRHAFGKYYVGAILPRSPAEQTGIRLGDRIVAVDGHPLTGLTEPVAARILEGKALSEARLVVARRWRRPFEITLTRQSEFSNTLARTPGNP